MGEDDDGPYEIPEHPALQQETFDVFAAGIRGIYRKWPLFPVQADTTDKTIRTFPGYMEFNKLTPEMRYFLFVCAVGQAVRISEGERMIRDAIGIETGLTAADAKPPQEPAHD